MGILELKNTISKGHKSIFELAEDIYVNWRTERKRMKKIEQNLRERGNIIKDTTICIMEVPKGEGREKGMEENRRNSGWKFPKFDGKYYLSIQKPQKTPSRKNSKRSTPRDIIVKMLKYNDKEKNVKAARKTTCHA